MDTKIIYSINQEELYEETLSFCDLSLENLDLDDQSLTLLHSPNSPSSHHEFFEFPFNPNTALNDKSDIVFCGKLIKEHDFDDNGDDDDDHQSRYLFPLFSAWELSNNKKDLGSLYLVNSSKANPSSLSTKSFRSRSCSLRKHKVLIGIIKMPPRMELSDLKKRQSRRNPIPMFPPPPPATGEMEVVDAADGCAGGKRGNRWSLLRSLRSSVHLFSALTKASLGCIPHV